MVGGVVGHQMHRGQEVGQSTVDGHGAEGIVVLHNRYLWILPLPRLLQRLQAVPERVGALVHKDERLPSHDQRHQLLGKLLSLILPQLGSI